MAQYKDPRQLAKAIQTIPEFDLEKTRNFWAQYGDFVTDDAYADWALKNGKKLGPKSKDTSGYNYQDQYLADEDWLRSTWDENYEDILRYAQEAR